LFGLFNTFIKPLLTRFALPFHLLTLGLISFVVNALMLEIVELLSGKIGITVDSGPFFRSTLEAAVIVTFASMVVSITVHDGS